MRISSFICACSLLAVFARIHLRNFLGFLTPDTYTGVLLRSSPGGGGCGFTLGRDAQRPGHVTGCPGRRAPRCCFHGGSGYCGNAGTLGCGLERPTWLVAYLSVAELPAARCGFFAHAFGFLRRVLGGGPLCLCRQRRGPRFGHWPGGWTPAGGFHRTTRFGRVQLVGFALARGGSGGRLGDRNSLLVAASVALPGLSVGAVAPYFRPDGRLGFCPPSLREDVPP
jgi:hypothetical protein